MLVSFAGQFESTSHSAIYATPRENCLLNGHLLFSALVETPANVRIFSFVVLPDDAEINLTGFPILERSLNPGKKTHGPQIHVLPESTADGDQESPKRDVIRHAGMPNGAEEDSVERPQLLQAIGGHHLSGFNVSFTTPIEGVPVQSKTKALPCYFQHANAFRHYFLSDAVSGDNCDVESFHVRQTLSFSFLGCQQRRKRTHIRGGIQGADKSDYFLGLTARPVCVFGASPEFCRCFFKSHGIRRATLPKISPACDDSVVLQMDFQQGGHFVVAGALGLRIYAKVYPADHFLDVGALNYFVRELAQPRLSFQHQNRHAEFHAEFGFQSGLWLVVEKSCRHVVIGTDVDLFYLSCLNIVGFDETRQLGHRGMREGARWIRF